MVDYKRFKLHQGQFEEQHIESLLLWATPENPECTGLPIFHTSECGKDWYNCQRNFAKNTLKFCYDADGVVRMASYDVSAIVPHFNWSVSEVVSKLDPEEVRNNYRFNGKSLEKIVVPNEVVNDAHRQDLFVKLDARISVLQNKIDDSDFEERHVKELADLRACRVALRKMDLSISPEKIQWPVLPI